MKIKALQAFTMRDAETGDLTSVACGAVEEVSDALGNQLITDGLAEAYTLISPTGTKTITENGTGIDVAQYASADVNVPNPSTGKLEITNTAEVDVTAYASAQVVDANLIAGNIKKDVDVLGVLGMYEGSGSPYELLYSGEVTASTTSTSRVLLETINVPDVYGTDLIFARIRDKAGPRNDYFYQTVQIVANYVAAYEGTTAFNQIAISCTKKSTGVYWYGTADTKGIFVSSIKSDDTVEISTEYNADRSGTIDGTYIVEIYKLAMPDGVPLFPSV